MIPVLVVLAVLLLGGGAALALEGAAVEEGDLPGDRVGAETVDFNAGDYMASVYSAVISSDEENGVILDENEVEALARVVRSEKGNGTPAERTAIAWAVRNRAARRGTTIYNLVSPWGPQGSGGRPFSSAQEARESDRETARAVLGAPAEASTCGSANSFDEPHQQDLCTAYGKLYRAGGGTARDATPQGSAPQFWRFRRYFLTAAEVRAKWLSEGQTLVVTIGRFDFWRI